MGVVGETRPSVKVTEEYIYEYGERREDKGLIRGRRLPKESNNILTEVLEP